MSFLDLPCGQFERPKVKDRFQKRGLLAFTGFLSSLLACLLALIGKWQSHEAIILVAIWVLVGGLFAALFGPHMPMNAP